MCEGEGGGGIEGGMERQSGSKQRISCPHTHTLTQYSVVQPLSSSPTMQEDDDREDSSPHC